MYYETLDETSHFGRKPQKIYLQFDKQKMMFSPRLLFNYKSLKFEYRRAIRVGNAFATHRTQMLELFAVGLAEHLLLVPGAQEIHAHHRAVVKQTPLEMTLKRRSRADRTAGKLYLYHPSTCLKMNKKENYSIIPLFPGSCEESASEFRFMHIFIINPEREREGKGVYLQPRLFPE